MGLFGSRTVTVPCTVEIEQTPESLHAHVTLDAGFEIEPGDDHLPSRLRQEPGHLDKGLVEELSFVDADDFRVS